MHRTALMKPLVSFAAVALAGATALGCSGDPGTAVSAESFPAAALSTLPSANGALTIEVRTAPEQPPSRGPSSVDYRITGQGGTPVDGLTIGVVPWMPAMGHGASVVPSVAPMGGGRYVISDVELFMPGQWELRTTFSGPAQDSVTPSFDIP
jgi:hypothetical protein